MKRFVITGFLVAMVAFGLLAVDAWAGHGMAVTYNGDDPNDGGTTGPEWTSAVNLGPVWLACDDPNDPNDPNDPGTCEPE